MALATFGPGPAAGTARYSLSVAKPGRSGDAGSRERRRPLILADSSAYQWCSVRAPRFESRDRALRERTTDAVEADRSLSPADIWTALIARVVSRSRALHSRERNVGITIPRGRYHFAPFL
jgi:hypothetical protein